MTDTVKSAVLCSSESETSVLGAAIGRELQPGDIVLLTGNLGAGKTVFAKALVSAASGVDPDEVVSPTFTLVNTFDGPFPVHHADLYRIDRGDTEALGLEESVEDGALVVEWGEKWTDSGDDPLRVEMAIADNPRARSVVFAWKTSGTWAQRMSAVLDEFGSET